MNHLQVLIATVSFSTTGGRPSIFFFYVEAPASVGRLCRGELYLDTCTVFVMIICASVVSFLTWSDIHCSLEIGELVQHHHCCMQGKYHVILHIYHLASVTAICVYCFYSWREYPVPCVICILLAITLMLSACCWGQGKEDGVSTINATTAHLIT